MKKHILIGITSGIAAYKIPDLIKLLQKDDIDVSVVLTRSASRMIPKQEIEKLTKQKVYETLFEDNFDYKTVLEQRSVDHINLADTTDLLVIAPATTNIIAKLAHGIADDYLTTTALAVTKPLLICPSMNVNMWNNKATQENIEILRSRGHHILEPAEGDLACGYVGKGRLEDVSIIKDEIFKRLNETSLLKGKRVLVTAGGTSEPIDSVRSITNRSSGKMGVAIAESCFLKGADVILLRAANSVKPRFVIQEETFETTNDLFALVKKYAKQADIVFHVAAVSDFSVLNRQEGKISSKQSLDLTLKPTVKISNEIKKINLTLLLVLFKAEHNITEQKLLHAAREKMKEAKADVVVANDISKSDQGFGADANELYVVLRDGTYKKFPLERKTKLADDLIWFVCNRLVNKTAALTL